MLHQHQPEPGIGPRDGARVEGLARVVTIRGCCNVYRRSVFDRVGLLDVRFSPSQFDEWDHHIACAVAGYEALYDGGVVVRHQLNAGRMATPAAYGNFEGNQLKSDARWGGDHWAALDRARVTCSASAFNALAVSPSRTALFRPEDTRAARSRTSASGTQ